MKRLRIELLCELDNLLARERVLADFTARTHFHVFETDFHRATPLSG
jgi:hypothetical protein